jgi:formyl-CoA transferase
MDLTDPADLEAVRGLAATCDVLIESYRPGALDKFGLGYTFT